MPSLFARHDVEDFDHWKKVYDDFDSARRQMGVIANKVYRGHDNPNDVTIHHEFETFEAAMAFFEDSRLREAMVEAGVTGETQVWFVEEV